MPLCKSHPYSSASSKPFCECQPSWPWKDKIYQGCDPTHPDNPTPWCFVKDLSCKTARPSENHPGSAWRYCSPGGCPGSEVAVQNMNSVNNLDLKCSSFAPLDKFCTEVQSEIRKLGAAGKVRMVPMLSVSSVLFHSACKDANLPKHWWESGDNRPAKQPQNKCLQGSSCLSIAEDRGPKFVTSDKFCKGKGVQFSYEVDPSSSEKVLEFTSREDFKVFGPLFKKYQQALSDAYTADLVNNHIAKSFQENSQVSGETVKFLVDMFKIPGYYASENAEMCLENNLIRKTLKEGKMIFEDDHKVGLEW